MSCTKKAKFYSYKSKLYSVIEKKIFLQILDNYKHIIEIKKGDNSTTLQKKEVAWNKICNEYNKSTLISRNRTVTQLKKLWVHMKHFEKNKLKNEKQSHMITGGEPPAVQIDIDPDIAEIAPNFLKNAPVLFSSNMSEVKTKDEQEIAFEVAPDYENAEFLLNDVKENSIILQDIPITPKKNNDKHMSKKSNNMLNKTKNTLKSEKIEVLDIEKSLKIERLKRIIRQEEELAQIKQAHEEKMIKIKEEYVKEMNNMQLQHLREMQKIEIQINKAKLRIIKCQSTN